MTILLTVGGVVVGAFAIALLTALRAVHDIPYPAPDDYGP